MTVRTALNNDVDSLVRDIPEVVEDLTATTIVWSDDLAATSPQLDWDLQGVDVGEEVKKATAEALNVNTSEEAFTDDELDEIVVESGSKLNNATTEVISNIAENAKAADSNDRLALVLTELQAGIDAQEDKRRSIQLLALGIALLGGKSASAAAQFASNLSKGSEKKINALYERRKMIMDAVTKKALEDAGYSTGDKADADKSVGTAGWVFSDGNTYFQVQDDTHPNGFYWDDGNGNRPPEGATPSHKTGTGSAGDLSARLQGQANKYDDGIDESNKINFRIGQIKAGLPEQSWWNRGLAGRFTETIKKALGTETAYSEFIRKVDALATSEALRNLPPGPASDRDVALMLRATTSGFADQEALIAYVDAVQRLSNYAIKYNTAKRDHLYANRGTEGFQPPAYEGTGTADTGTSGGLSTSSSDLDDILNS